MDFTILAVVLLLCGGIPLRNKIYKERKKKKEDKKKVVSPTEQEYYDWKKRTNEFVDKLSESSKFTDRNSVLKYLYDYINKTYGIVWDQEKRESTEEDIPIFLKFLHLMLFMKMNNCVQFSIVLWQIWLKSIKIHAK